LNLSDAPGIPYHRQIVEQVARSIRSGDLAPDSSLPSVREMASRLLVSRTAVRQAYADLEAAGLIVRNPDRRVHVATDAAAASREMALDQGSSLLSHAVARARGLGLTGGDVDAVEAERLAWEVEMAAGIQRRLLPGSDPVIDGYDIAGLSLPCREIGGDLYDFVPCADRTLALAIADVTGKGVPASLMVSTLHASIRLLIDDGRPLTEVVGRANRQFHSSSPENRFAGLFLARLDVPTGRVVSVNAGQDPPILLRREGRAETLTRGGLLVGCLPDASYESEATSLEPGDLLLASTDGITETLSGEGEQYGLRRLVDHVRRNRELPAGELARSLITAVEQFSDGSPATDDRTVVVVKRLQER
jgi:serine phosphatase RsbU (regulator of sigma subunit)